MSVMEGIGDALPLAEFKIASVLDQLLAQPLRFNALKREALCRSTTSEAAAVLNTI